VAEGIDSLPPFFLDDGQAARIVLNDYILRGAEVNS
jgi:hypothetical protein